MENPEQILLQQIDDSHFKYMTLLQYGGKKDGSKAMML